MKRPIVLCAVCCSVMSVCGTFFGINAFLIAAVLCFISGIACMFKFRETAIVPVLVVLLTVNMLLNTNVKIKNIAAVNAQDSYINGIVTDVDFYGSNVYYTINVKESEKPELQGIKMCLSSSASTADIGDTISCNAVIYTVTDRRTQYYSNGVFAVGRITETNAVTSGKGVTKTVYNVQKAITDKLFSNMSPQSAATVNALLCGNREYQTKEFSQAVRKSGVSHVMVVSGMHMSILCGGVYFLLEKIKTGRNLRSIIMLLVIAAFMTLCGFTPSVIRAGITYLIMISGNLLLRRSDGLASLCCAVTLITLVNPLITGNVGYLLSVSATFGLIVLYPLLEARVKIRNKFVREFTKTVLTAFSALVTTAPISLIFFGSITPIAIVTNVCISYAVTGALIFAAVGTAMYFLPFGEFLCKIPYTIADIAAKYCNAVINFFGSV